MLHYLLINDHSTFENVQIIFKLKNRFTCDSFNLIYVVICHICKKKYIGQTGEGKLVVCLKTAVISEIRVNRKYLFLTSVHVPTKLQKPSSNWHMGSNKKV